MTYTALIILILLVTALLYIFNRYVLKNKSVLTRIILSICLLLGIIIIGVGIVALIWYNSPNPRQKAEEEWSRHKHFTIINEKMEGLRCIVSYTHKDEDGDHQVNDTVLLSYGKDSPYDGVLPIPFNDSTSFPDNFHLKFQDSLQRTVAEYNKDQFLRESTIAPEVLKNKMSAINWTLVIEDNNQ